jgi:DNA topoisomerase II
VTGGRNGYGAKLANVFSKLFRVTVENDGQRYTQEWRDNMSVRDAPVIVKAAASACGVRIDFVPDWERFGGAGDFGALVEKRTWDAALWCTKAKVTFNGAQLSVHDLEDYARRHLGPDVPVAKMHTGAFDIVVGHSTTGQFDQVSFVNGIATTKGGTHVERVASLVIAEILKDKRVASARPFQVRASLFVFVRATIINPTFTSQTKAECTSKITELIEPLKPKFIKDVLATGVLDDLLSLGAAKAERELKKTDGSKKVRITGVPKLDDANWAGTARSTECTLVITEGDSAKALAVAGLSVVGRDAYGVYPLRGKPRNVRDASAKQVADNAEFNDLKKILGLQHGKVYNSLRELRYGRLMIMTDADLDGSHIKGLVLNMFHVYWPSLIRLGFVVSMVTPVIKAGKQWFFTEEAFRAAGPTKGAVKYYKGLGTSTSAEAKEYFGQIERLTVKFTPDATMDDSMVLAFAKSQADERKTWLRGHMAAPPPGVPYGSLNALGVTDFVHRDLACFSVEDIRRSIPHVADGLKPSQRKVIYACLKRGLTADMKVAQLSGYVAEQTAYHHGEASLQGTIINLAQNFVGTNNLNLLEPSGQFGTRLQGGKDHASARYIFTRLSPATAKIFDERDNAVLKHLVDDGQTVEPEYYAPVVPMILVNGGEGIGTGFSCYVPPFDPAVIAQNIKNALDGAPLVPMQPFFKGFTGKTTAKAGAWVLEGTWTRVGDTVRVTELPPGKWIQDFKEHLDDLVEKGTITRYENHSTESTPDFRIVGELTDPVKELGLAKTVHVSNMYLIGADGAVKKFASAEEILLDYMRIRHALYKKRKAHVLRELETEAHWLAEKARFITLVTAGALLVFRRTKAELDADMVAAGFSRAHAPKMLDIKTSGYTAEEIARLVAKASAATREMEALRATSVSDMWKHNLSVL